MTDPSALDDAWQAALAAEQQACFGYGLLGPRLDSADLSLAVTCSDDHETLRDDTQSALATAGLDPVQGQPDYPSLYPVDTAAAAVQLAARLEDDCATAWRYLYAVAAGTGSARGQARRGAAQVALTASAVRATRWRVVAGAARATTAFPGID